MIYARAGKLDLERCESQRASKVEDVPRPACFISARVQYNDGSTHEGITSPPTRQHGNMRSSR